MPIYYPSEATQREVSGEGAGANLGGAFDALMKISSEHKKSTLDLFKILAKSNPQLTALVIADNPTLLQQLAEPPHIRDLYAQKKAIEGPQPSAQSTVAKGEVSLQPNGPDAAAVPAQGPGAPTRPLSPGDQIVAAFHAAGEKLASAKDAYAIPMKPHDAYAMIQSAYETIPKEVMADPAKAKEALTHWVTAFSHFGGEPQAKSMAWIAKQGWIDPKQIEGIKKLDAENQYYIAWAQRDPNFGIGLGIGPHPSPGEVVAAMRSPYQREIASAMLIMRAQDELRLGQPLKAETREAINNNIVHYQDQRKKLLDQITESRTSYEMFKKNRERRGGKEEPNLYEKSSYEDLVTAQDALAKLDKQIGSAQQLLDMNREVPQPKAGQPEGPAPEAGDIEKRKAAIRKANPKLFGE